MESDSSEENEENFDFLHESELNTNIEITNYSDIQKRIAGLSKNEDSRLSEIESRIASENNDTMPTKKQLSIICKIFLSF